MVRILSGAPTSTIYFVAELLEPPSALNEIDDEDNESNYEQEMDQAAPNVAEQSKKPEY